jgi:hypothetical protein
VLRIRLMRVTLKGISHPEVLNADSREANGIKTPQKTRNSSQKEFVDWFPFCLQTLSKLHIFVVAFTRVQIGAQSAVNS